MKTIASQFEYFARKTQKQNQTECKLPQKKVKCLKYRFGVTKWRKQNEKRIQIAKKGNFRVTNIGSVISITEPILVTRKFPFLAIWILFSFCLRHLVTPKRYFKHLTFFEAILAKYSKCRKW